MDVAVDDGCSEGGDGRCGGGFDLSVSRKVFLLVGADGEIFSNVKGLCRAVTI